MRVLRILTLIGFVAISIGMAIRFWIDGLPSVEPFQGVLQVPERARQVVTASEQIGQPPESRGSSHGPKSGASSVRFTIGLGRAPEASFPAAPGATGSGEAPAPPRVGSPPPSPQPPAPAPAPTPPPPVVPPAPPTPAPPQPAAPSAPTAAPAAPPSPGPATAPTPPKPKPHPKPKPTPTPPPAPAPAPPPPPPPPSTPGEPSGDTKPGWGKGDKNHDHTGPPGAAESHGKP